MTGNLSLWGSTPASSPLNSSAPPPPPPWEAPSFTAAARCRVAATVVLFVFAAASNLSVLISVCWGRGYRLAAHLRPLIASLASADLVMTFVVMPLDAVWNITVQWYAGDVMCKLLCFLKLFAMQSAAFILVVVSVDRYWAILHPLDSLDAGLRNKRMLLVAWTLSLLLASPQVQALLGSQFNSLCFM
ncbi:Gonadotropin-releasing hormone II receptor [Liparis tanakae]|uniref:Gonadotropin-releasing hormone II receptor n=1 Tax=Liparis tanakae TaxID=230148 RepID=A0A4Z2DYS1_9TELE|nr:Gonadotropin-releasing hormone II receptor [Liparis tanakae]